MIEGTIGRYEVEGLLGEGAFGQVYAARDPVLGRTVAIKVLRTSYSTDASFMERFRAEAASLAALAHPNITAIYDLLQSGSQHGMIMELVRGHTLEHVIQLRRQLTPRQALAIVAQTVSGLGYVHRRSVVHRDIKPSNIMLTAEGVLKIMDFGIARVQGAKRLTRDGSVVGTLAYAAPEQIKTGEGEPRSDQYSLACVFYEMLCGNPPFDAATEYELMQAQIAKPPEPASKFVAGLSDQIDRALMRALAKNPGDRYESVEEFGRALGIDSVQLQAIDIVAEVVASAGQIAPLPQRPSSPDAASPNAASPDAAANRPAAEVRPPQAAAPARPEVSGSRSLRPLMAMGAAASIAIAVMGYIFIDSRVPVKSSSGVTQADAGRPAVAEKTAPKPDEAPPSVASRPSPPAADTPARSEPAAPKAAEVLPVEPRPEPQISESQASGARVSEPRVGDPRVSEPREIQPRLDRLPSAPSDSPPIRRIEEPGEQARPKIAMQTEAETTNSKPGPKLAPKPDVAKPDEKVAARPAERPDAKPGEAPAGLPAGPPNYKGRVLNWPSAGTIRVRAATGTNPEFFRLFGVRDLPMNKQSEVDSVSDKLEAFFATNGREVTCFKRYSGEFKDTRYLCFVGNRDIGQWAIENNLGLPNNDAPPHYRQATR